MPQTHTGELSKELVPPTGPKIKDDDGLIRPKVSDILWFVDVSCVETSVTTVNAPFLDAIA